MSNMRVHFSRKTGEWSTPQDLFDRLNEKYQFTVDVCATAENAKCAKYYTKEQDGRAQSWDGERVWMNPPYGRGIANWVRLAAERSDFRGVFTVALLPARTDTKWFHYYCKGRHIEFIKGRLKFGGATKGAPFPSMLVYF